MCKLTETFRTILRLTMWTHLWHACLYLYMYLYDVQYSTLQAKHDPDPDHNNIHVMREELNLIRIARVENCFFLFIVHKIFHIHPMISKLQYIQSTHIDVSDINLPLLYYLQSITLLIRKIIFPFLLFLSWVSIYLMSQLLAYSHMCI